MTHGNGQFLIRASEFLLSGFVLTEVSKLGLDKEELCVAWYTVHDPEFLATIQQANQKTMFP